MVGRQVVRAYCISSRFWKTCYFFFSFFTHSLFLSSSSTLPFPLLYWFFYCYSHFLWNDPLGLTCQLELGFMQAFRQILLTKQCKPWSNCSLGAVWAGFTLFTIQPVLYTHIIMFRFSGASLGGSVGCASDWWSGGCWLDPRWVGNSHSWRFDHEIFSMVILSLWLIQEGQLSVSDGRMCPRLVNSLED